MLKKTGLIYIIILFACIAGFLFYRSTVHSIEIADNRISQIFKMRSLNNEPIQKPETEFIVINFWASWCPPCIEETPSLVRFTEKHSGQFTLFALSQDTAKKDIEDFVKTFPSLRSPFITIVHDDSQTVARAFEVDKLPETFIYSVKQNKYFRVSGSTNWDQPEVIVTLNKYFNVSL